MKPELEQLLTPNELLDILKIKQRQLDNLIQTGRIQVVKVGRLNRFSPSYIKEWMKQGREATR
jgi:excisionase family DNA binding protein